MRNTAPILTVLAAMVSAACAPGAWAFDARLETSAGDTLTERLMAASAVLQAADEQTEDSSEIIAAVQSDYRNLIAVLYRNGYYGPNISIRVDGQEASGMSLVSLPSQIQTVVLDVDPGPRFRFGSVSIAPRPAGTELPDSLSKGEIAKSNEIAEATTAVIDDWRAQSHAKASVSGQSITADHGSKVMDVKVEINPGPAVRFGQMKFAGETDISPKRLREIANLPEGKSFDPELLDLVSKRLQNTGTFRSITLREADELTPDGALDITATLVEEKPRRLGAGVEFSSIEGATLSAFWMHRNLTQNADRLRFDGEIAGLGGSTGIDYTLSTAYRRPATITRKTTLVLGAELAHLDEPDYLSDTGEVTLGFDVETSPNSTFTIGMGYRYAQVEDAISRSTSVDNRTFEQVIFPITGSRDTRDNRLNPGSGTYFEAEILPFVGVNGSTSGTRVFADGRGYLSFGEKLVLAGRAQIGSILGADNTEVPPDMLFFSGGGGTVRGHPYQSLSLDFSGDDIGGASFLGASAELRAKIKNKISLVGFYDIGGIGPNSTPGQDMVWHSGAGLGLRYDTGVGPIRLDLAAPVTGDTGDGLQIYIGIGQAF